MGIQFILCSQTEGHCAVFIFFHFIDFVQNGLMLEQKVGGKRQAVVFLIYVFRKCLNKQYAAQSRVCFSAGQAFFLEGETKKAEI